MYLQKIYEKLSLLISYPKLTIYVFALIMQIAGILVYHQFFSSEIIIYDPRYEQLAMNIIKEGTFKIEWGVGEKTAQLMQHPYNIWEGVYYNWFPIGYSLVLAPTMLFEKYKLILTIFQLLLFSFIPVLLFLVFRHFFSERKFERYISFLIAILWCFYPYFLVSSLWRTDTWIISLLNLASFYYLLKFYTSGFRRSFAYRLAFLLIVLFFFRPIVLFPYSLIIFAWGLMNYKKNLSFNSIVKVLFLVLMAVGLWTFRNYSEFGVLNFTQSNIGYNLWLGNNRFTNDFMKRRFGDGATIEDEIIPKFDKSWSFLKYCTEYEKDAFFKKQALNFIKENPIESLENVAWKVIGFWSPLRMRSGHWSDSKLKQFFTFIFQSPVLILSILSIFIFFKKKEYKNKKKKSWLIIFMFLYMFPYLLFFSSTRFRAPIDFCLLLLSADYLYPKIISGISKFRIKAGNKLH